MMPSHKCIRKDASMLLELTNNELYLMTLLNHRPDVNCLVVIIALRATLGTSNPLRD
jgi:hypothetical protein